MAAFADTVTKSPTAADIHFSISVQSGFTYLQLKIGAVMSPAIYKKDTMRSGLCGAGTNIH